MVIVKSAVVRMGKGACGSQDKHPMVMREKKENQNRSLNMCSLTLFSFVTLNLFDNTQYVF